MLRSLSGKHVIILIILVASAAVGGRYLEGTVEPQNPGEIADLPWAVQYLRVRTVIDESRVRSGHRAAPDYILDDNTSTIKPPHGYDGSCSCPISEMTEGVDASGRSTVSVRVPQGAGREARWWRKPPPSSGPTRHPTPMGKRRMVWR